MISKVQPDHLTLVKYDPPSWFGSHLRRDALLSQLNGALDKRLTIIHAPAGYGKTSLLSQWRVDLERRGINVGWLTADRDDADLSCFQKSLHTGFGGQVDREQNQNPGDDLPPRAAISALVRLLSDTDTDRVLIIDDLHKACSDTVLTFLGRLIRATPGNCHFVVATRDYLSIGQSVLMAEGQCLEMTSSDLRFSTGEVETLVKGQIANLPKEHLDAIVLHTEGWPIAVSLIALSLEKYETDDTLAIPSLNTDTELARYLSEQVLRKLPSSVYEMVLRTAIVDRLDGDLLGLLCDRQDGWVQLERLEGQGIFLTPNDDTRREYRYHQMFAEYVRDVMRKSQPDLHTQLHARAAKWFADNGRIADAMEHAVICGNTQLITSIIEDAGGWRLIANGLQGIVEKGLTALPEAVIERRPRLVLTLVYLRMKGGDLRAARQILDRFKESDVEQSLSADLRIELHVVEDTLSDYENQPVTLADLIDREALLRKFTADDHLVFANFSETIAAKYYEGGWLERALQPTFEARAHYQACNSLYSEIFTRFLEARIKRAQGRAKDAINLLTATFEDISANFGDRSDLAANCCAFLAQLHYEQNEITRASDLLEWALPHMEQSDAWVDVYAAAYFTSARISASNGMLDEARDMIARARRTAQWRRLHQLELLADICDVEVHLACAADRELVKALARSLNLADHAASMWQDSPHYRPVSVAAFLVQCRLQLQDTDVAALSSNLKRFIDRAQSHGAGRVLIDAHLLMALAHLEGKDSATSKMYFDEAVGIAMHQGISRPFVDFGHELAPFLVDVCDGDKQINRFRTDFLQVVSKGISESRIEDTCFGPFTLPEAEALYYLSLGYSNKEIARLINMSPDTVKYRLKSLFKKIGVSKRKDAVRMAAERGLIPSQKDLALL
ncbi:MAG: LuxR C-terminal-related transcriptional regulator [Pseudomonadota bacterium]